MTAPVSPPSSPPRAVRTPMAPAAAFALLYRTFLRSARTRGRIICLIILTGIAVLLAVVPSSAEEGEALTQALDISVPIVTQLVAIGALVVASAVLGDLYDNGSIVYVALRPVSNRIVAAAAWAAACTIVLPAAVVSALAVVLAHSGDGLVPATVLAAVLGTVAYAAIFGFVGVLVRRALPAGLAYLLLWEGFVSLAGKAGATVTVSGYLRSVLARITGGDLEAAPFVLASGIIAPLAITVVALWGTGWLLDRRELP